jgi:hypothetical protein
MLALYFVHLGKLTVMASSIIIEDIETMRKSGLASLAMFYCDFKEDQKKDVRGLLASVLFQLSDQSDSYHDILATFYSTHRNGAQSPSDDELSQCLQDLLELPGQAPVYLIIDALDECPNTTAIPSPHEKVLKFVVQLIESRLVMAKSGSPLWFGPNRTEQNRQVRFTVRGYCLNRTVGPVQGSPNPLEM